MLASSSKRSVETSSSGESAGVFWGHARISPDFHGCFWFRRWQGIARCGRTKRGGSSTNDWWPMVWPRPTSASSRISSPISPRHASSRYPNIGKFSKEKKLTNQPATRKTRSKGGWARWADSVFKSENAFRCCDCALIEVYDSISKNEGLWVKLGTDSVFQK